jgi:hypothetical protein
MGNIRHGKSQSRGGVRVMDAALLLTALTLISWPASAWAFDCIAGETLQVRSNSHRIKPKAHAKQEATGQSGALLQKAKVRKRSASLTFAFNTNLHLPGGLLRSL